MKISVKEYLLRSLRECDESDSMLLELLRAYRDLKNNQPERSKREDDSLTTMSEPSELCKEAMAKMFWS